MHVSPVYILSVCISFSGLAACQAAGAAPAAPDPCAGSPAAAVSSVGTTAELMQALSQTADADGPKVSRIELQQDITLSPDATQNYSLPMFIGSETENRTLELGASGPMRSLDFGGIAELVYFHTGSSFVLFDLNISGAAHKGILGASFEDPSAQHQLKAPTAAQNFHLFPTINFGPNTTATVCGVNLTLTPSPGCTADVVAQQASALQLLLGRTDAVWASGTTSHVQHIPGTLPVVDAGTRADVGSMVADIWSTNTTCLPAPAPAPAAAAPSDASSSAEGGTPGWVWAVVAVVASVALGAAAAGALLWRRRSARLRAMVAMQGPEEVEAGVNPESTSASTPGPLESSSSPGATGKGSSSPGATGKGSSSSAGPAPAVMGKQPDAAVVPLSPQASTEAEESGELDAMWKASRVGFIDGLRVAGILGGGGFGRVYKGRWKGVAVAVKVVVTHVTEFGQINLAREPLLSMSLSHPNIVPSYKACVVRVLQPEESGEGQRQQRARSSEAGSSSSGGGGGGSSRVVHSLTDRNAMVEIMPSTAVLEPGLYETWLVLEYADKGSLFAAIKAGVFKASDGGRNMRAILPCLLDVGRGLEYLHACNIMHGDLKPQNVLLKREKQDQRGYVCKLADFGLSRILQEHQTHVSTGSFGTASHAAPELMLEGRLTKAGDVYALGILMWELLTSEIWFRNVPVLQIVNLVTNQHFRPQIPEGCPQPLADLMRRCWSSEPAARPDVSAVLRALKDCAPAVRGSS